MEKHQLDTENIVNSFLNLENTNPRYERKFRTKMNSSSFMNGYLEQFGFYQDHPQRLVNTLYFDTINFKFAIDNINGERYRIKPRLRWYKDLSTNLLSETKLEYKIKDGFLGYKFSNKASLSEVSNLIENRLGVVGFPTIETSYKRLYLTSTNGIRATIDFDIFATVFSNSTKIYHNLNYEIIEFKYEKDSDDYFRQTVFKHINKYPLFRLNKSSKYIEGLLQCQLKL